MWPLQYLQGENFCGRFMARIYESRRQIILCTNNELDLNVARFQSEFEITTCTSTEWNGASNEKWISGSKKYTSLLQLCSMKMTWYTPTSTALLFISPFWNRSGSWFLKLDFSTYSTFISRFGSPSFYTNAKACSHFIPAEWTLSSMVYISHELQAAYYWPSPDGKLLKHNVYELYRYFQILNSEINVYS